MLCIGVSIAVVAAFVLLYNRIFSITFDEAFAQATGLKTGRYNMIVAVMVALVIVLGMNLVGALLLSDICKKHGIAIRHIILRQDAWCRWLVFALSTAVVLLFGVWGPSFSEANFIYFQF